MGLLPEVRAVPRSGGLGAAAGFAGWAEPGWRRVSWPEPRCVTENMDDAWAMRMILNRSTREAHRRRDELAAAVDELATGFTALGMKPWKSTSESDARRNAKAPDVALGERTESLAKILRYESAVNILSAADQLRGFAVLLRAEASLMGAVAVSRGVFEACLWATALIDPTITTDERLQRALTRRLARLSAGIRLQNLLGGDVVDANQIIQEEDDQHGTNRNPAEDIDDIVAYAKARGWPVGKGRRAWEIRRSRLTGSQRIWSVALASRAMPGRAVRRCRTRARR